MSKVSKAAGGALSEKEAKPYIEQYRKILVECDQQCPKSTRRKKGQRGRIAQTKARNL